MPESKRPNRIIKHHSYREEDYINFKLERIQRPLAFINIIKLGQMILGA